MSVHDPIAIVGAGLSGATIAYELAWRGFRNITVFDQRSHVAGNTHTERDPQTGIMLHVYGPHIFHTDDENIWKWFGQFGTLMPYIQRTKALCNDGVYSLPINLHTINQFYGRQFTPHEAECFIAHKQIVGHVLQPTNFEEAALGAIGPDLYEAFFRNYTVKQWGLHPTQLPASVFGRLPIRFNYNDNAFSHAFQGVPRDGYTASVANMLDHPAITVALNKKFNFLDAKHHTHTFYSGCIDEWFDYRLGSLPYRTLEFKKFVKPSIEDAQGCAVLNSCDLETPWTRRTEHKHFTPWEPLRPGTVVFEEHSRQHAPGDIPYYPIRFAKDKQQLLDYQQFAQQERNVTFCGRLGTYQYLDMDKTISLAMTVARDFARKDGTF